MMDRKEAADLLDNLIGMVEDSHGADYDTALKMGIEALSANGDGQEPVGDTISRQAAIDALDRIFDRCEEIEAHLPEGDPDRTGYKMYPDYMTVWKYLHQLPSAQPEIIRCKDCKKNPHWEWVGCPMTGKNTRKPDDFCSYAERRTDERA